MTTARNMCALALVVVVAGCESGALLPDQGGTYAFTQAEERLESYIGDSRRDTPVTAAGTLLGPFLGSDVGELLNKSDRQFAEDAARKSLEEASPGTAARWKNPETGHAGSFTPTNIYRSVDDLICRDYVQGVSAKGQTLNRYGTACRTSDGSWRVALGAPVRRATRR